MIKMLKRVIACSLIITLVFSLSVFLVSAQYECKAGQIIGDVNGDSKITKDDANLVAEIAVGNIAKPSNVCCVDANKDGKIDVTDSLKIARIAEGLEGGVGVCISPTIPSITVISPNGGEVYKYGDYLKASAKIVSQRNGIVSWWLVDKSKNYERFIGSGGFYPPKNEYIASIVLQLGDIPQGYNYQILAQWKSDDGLELLSDNSDAPFSIVEAGVTCTDSDNGKNYYVYGEVKFKNNYRDYVFKDFCEGSRVYDYFCDETNTYSLSYLDCPYGCKDGACIQSAQPSITVLSPNGGEKFTYGQFVTAKAKIISSKDSGTVSWYLIGGTAYERFIGSGGFSPLKYDGIASIGLTITEDIPAGSNYQIKVIWKSADGMEGLGDASDAPFSIVSALNASCTDSDGGINYYVQGTVASCDYSSLGGACIASQDVCDVYNKGIKELYCDGAKISSVYYQCPNGCKDGACIREKPEKPVCGNGICEEGEKQCTVVCPACVVGTPPEQCKCEETCTYTCPQDCQRACPKIYKPVCGVDSKTYGNSCEAEKAGVKIECEGECPCNIVMVKEQVKCVFKGSVTVQDCYSEKGSCKGVNTCVVDVQGKKGEKITWKSSCGGYAYTIIDGKSKYANFNCRTKKVTKQDVIDYINKDGINATITKQEAIAYINNKCYGTMYGSSSASTGYAIAPIILS